MHAKWQEVPSTVRKMSTSIKCSHNADLSPVTRVMTRVTDTRARRHRDTNEIEIKNIIEEITTRHKSRGTESFARHLSCKSHKFTFVEDV